MLLQSVEMYLYIKILNCLNNGEINGTLHYQFFYLSIISLTTLLYMCCKTRKTPKHKFIISRNPLITSTNVQRGTCTNLEYNLESEIGILGQAAVPCDE